MLKIFRDPNNPDVLRVVVYENPGDDEPATIREIDMADDHGDEVDDIPADWVELA
ncbi:hypothetical protein [Saccharopolyspora taberi]|uniref:Uncharacterized protein n=1 Tax=Saccharopolyspora taberi TaxID=60895 RepID=A0ABN3V149_9PSEU